jgi:hypothetical protein
MHITLLSQEVISKAFAFLVASLDSLYAIGKRREGVDRSDAALAVKLGQGSGKREFVISNSRYQFEL